MATASGCNLDAGDIYIRSIEEQQADKCKYIFDQYDERKCGEITLADLRQMLGDPELLSLADRHTRDVLEMKCIGNFRRGLTYQEFINIMSSRRNISFRLAVENQIRPAIIPLKHILCPSEIIYQPPEPSTCFTVMVRRIAREFLTDDLERRFYEDNYRCCPPPLFIPIITIIEVSCFVYHCLEAGSLSHNGPIPVNSALIYRPDRRLELWRFVFYMFIHAGWVHLFFNMLVQIVVGIPLEMVHGSCRIATVYMAGVLAGSLGTSVLDMNAFLVGASGGVYALLAGHMANILLNYAHMELGFLKLSALLLIAIADVGFAVWDRYTRKSPPSSSPPMGYAAHLLGALAGLTVGLVVLKNFEQRLHDQYLWWIALATYLGCVVFAILWNIFFY